MSSGATHDKVTLFLAPIVFIGAFLYFGHLAWFMLCAFLFAGFMFNGDLDIHSNVYNRWLIFKYIWKPYHWFGHRSMWTHGPVIGTIIRVLWLTLPCSIALYYTGNMHLAMQFVLTYKMEFIVSLIGLELGSISHTFMDWMSTGFKKLT